MNAKDAVRKECKCVECFRGGVECQQRVEFSIKNINAG